jgi:hypothetical protein
MGRHETAGARAAAQLLTAFRTLDIQYVLTIRHAEMDGLVHPIAQLLWERAGMLPNFEVPDHSEAHFEERRPRFVLTAPLSLSQIRSAHIDDAILPGRGG